MFKLVVLCALLAVAAAEPSLLYAPTAYSTVLAPSTTTITKQASSVVHPSPPVVYSSPLTFTHFIKKRSLAALPFAAPTYYNSPVIASPFATTYSAPVIHSASLLHSAPIFPAAHLPYAPAHLIKKRSAPFLYAPTTYAASAPLLTTSYTAAAPLHAAPLHTAPLISTPLISHPITYTSHFIKKRSAPILTSYAALPTSYSHQSRVDFTHSSPYITTYSAPIAYSSPLAVSHISHLFKK